MNMNQLLTHESINNEKGIMCLIKKGDYKAVVANLLKPEG